MYRKTNFKLITQYITVLVKNDLLENSDIQTVK